MEATHVARIVVTLARGTTGTWFCVKEFTEYLILLSDENRGCLLDQRWLRMTEVEKQSRPFLVIEGVRRTSSSQVSSTDFSGVVCLSAHSLQCSLDDNENL